MQALSIAWVFRQRHDQKSEPGLTQATNSREQDKEQAGLQHNLVKKGG